MPASHLLALGAIALWATLASLGTALSHLPPFLLTGLALAIGSVLSLPSVMRDRRSWRPAFLVLSGWGAVLASQMLQPGPWMQHMVPLFWQIQGAAYASILILVAFQTFRARQAREQREPRAMMQGKAA